MKEAVNFCAIAGFDSTVLMSAAMAFSPITAGAKLSPAIPA
jgi:hypothetical protein